MYTWSVVVLGTNSPFLLPIRDREKYYYVAGEQMDSPTHSLPMILQSAIEACTTGMASDNSPSNTLRYYMERERVT